MQENIVIGEDTISGTLKYVSDYTGFSGNPELQSGHYIALHIDVPDVEDVTIQVTLTGTATLDEDRTIVLYIADQSTQTITVVASKEGYESVTKTFALTGLTLSPAG